VVEFWWRRLREVETGKGRRLGAIIFRGEEGEVARRLHSAGGGRHSEERCGGWSLEVEDDQRKLGRWAKCTVGPDC
jgi:hypothetical protein